jgi:hypothetical protein
LANLTFTGLFAADAAGPGFEISDIIEVQYRFDGSGSAPFTPLLRFLGQGAPAAAGTPMRRDDDLDGVIAGTETALGIAALSFNVPIPIVGTPSTLDLRVLMSNTTTGEEIAFDSITIQGIESIPEPSAIVYGSLLCGVIELGYVSRKLFASKTA